ncbi:MAG: replication factor C large subunit [Candidatus Bilamarchaeaceae archaeon]
MLCSKYAPASLDSMAGNDEARGKVRAWMLKWLNGEPRKPLLLWGPPGIGKTSSAYALRNEYGLDLVEMNASALRDAKSVEKVLSHALMAGNLFGRKKMILIDDVDAVQKDDRGGLPLILKVMRESPFPILITATNAWEKKIANVRMASEPVEMKRVPKFEMKRVLLRIIKSEGISESVSPELLERVLENAEGDVRAAVNDLEARCSSGRDRDKNVFDEVRAVFKARTYADSKVLTRGSFDYDSMKLWVDENLPAEFEDSVELASAYDALSRSDIFGRRMRGAWVLMKYAIDLSTAGVALARAKPSMRFVKYQFPSYLKEMARTAERRNMLKRVGAKLARRIHANRREALDYMFVVKSLAARFEHEAVMDFYFLDEEEFEFVVGKAPERAKAKDADKAGSETGESDGPEDAKKPKPKSRKEAKGKSASAPDAGGDGSGGKTDNGNTDKGGKAPVQSGDTKLMSFL